MSFEAFTTNMHPALGRCGWGTGSVTDAERPSTRLGPQARNFQATLALGDRIGTSSASACGPVAALTEMLYDRGIAVEMTAFHQLPAGAHTATFVRGCDGARSQWAMGWSDDPTQSALRAVICLCEPASHRRLSFGAESRSAADGARSACRPWAPACRRNPTSPCSQASAARADTCAAADA